MCILTESQSEMSTILCTVNSFHHGSKRNLFYNNFMMCILYLIKQLLKGYLKDEPEKPEFPVKLSEICEISTNCEIEAQEAERESIRAKQIEFPAARRPTPAKFLPFPFAHGLPRFVFSRGGVSPPLDVCVATDNGCGQLHQCLQLYLWPLLHRGYRHRLRL